MAYGIGQTPYAARFGELGDSFGDVLRSLVTRPFLVLKIALEPLRLRYLFGLLIPTALLGLFGAEILLVGLPLLLANLLNSFPLQYSGELHYSAPLVPIFTFAAVVGLARLIRNYKFWREGFQVNRRPVSGIAFALGLVMVCALGYQVADGYTPIGKEFRQSQPGGWPQVTAHQRLLDRFAAQIPPDAALSVTTDLYPHLDHRELIYQFPILGNAQWALVDVSGTTDEHPADVQEAIGKMMAAGWGVVDAADGYILLAQGRGEAEIPDDFYDFARVSAGGAAATSAARPQYPLDVTFGDKLRLIGYDVVDNAKWRRTNFRFYWEVLEPLPADTAIINAGHHPGWRDCRRHGATAHAGAAVVSAGELAARRDHRNHQRAVVSPACLGARVDGHRRRRGVDAAGHSASSCDARPIGRRWPPSMVGCNCRPGSVARDGCGPMPTHPIRERRRRPASTARTGGSR